MQAPNDKLEWMTNTGHFVVKTTRDQTWPPAEWCDLNTHWIHSSEPGAEVVSRRWGGSKECWRGTSLSVCLSVCKPTYLSACLSVLARRKHGFQPQKHESNRRLLVRINWLPTSPALWGPSPKPPGRKWPWDLVLCSQALCLTSGMWNCVLKDCGCTDVQGGWLGFTPKPFSPWGQKTLPEEMRISPKILYMACSGCHREYKVVVQEGQKDSKSGPQGCNGGLLCLTLPLYKPPLY